MKTFKKIHLSAAVAAFCASISQAQATVSGIVADDLVGYSSPNYTPNVHIYSGTDGNVFINTNASTNLPGDGGVNGTENAGNVFIGSNNQIRLNSTNSNGDISILKLGMV